MTYELECWNEEGLFNCTEKNLGGQYYSDLEQVKLLSDSGNEMVNVSFMQELDDFKVKSAEPETGLNCDQYEGDYEDVLICRVAIASMV